jgi:hypothetical protein
MATESIRTPFKNLLNQIRHILTTDVTALDSPDYTISTLIPVNYAPSEPAIRRAILGQIANKGMLNFPCAYILPLQDTLEEMASNTQQHNHLFQIVIVCETTTDEHETVYYDVWDLAYNVAEVFLTNRSVDGVYHDNNVGSIAPYQLDARADDKLEALAVEITFIYETTVT